MKNSTLDLNTMQAFILDLDGVIWRGDALLPGAKSLFEFFQAHSFPYVFVTNNATLTPQHFCDKARRLGLIIHADQVITSSHAAVRMLQAQFPTGARIFVIGENGLLETLSGAQFRITQSAQDAQAVVVGMDRQVNWQKMAEAAYAISRGAFFLGTNLDPSFPTERGLAPGNGAIIQALQVTTGIEAHIVGKPKPDLFFQALEHMGTPAEKTLGIGDRLATDIQGGKNAGIPTALVLTGVTSKEELARSPLRPDFVFENLNELIMRLAGGLP